MLRISYYYNEPNKGVIVTVCCDGAECDTQVEIKGFGITGCVIRSIHDLPEGWRTIKSDHENAYSDYCPGCGPTSENRRIQFTYLNYKGETSERVVVPQRIWFGSTGWHGPQWLMHGYDVNKKAMRDFAIKDISEWRLYGDR